MKVLILAGGRGEGLWPLSRKDYPKQFMEIQGESFFRKTIMRCLLVVSPGDIFAVTSKDYFFYVRSVLHEFGIGEKNIIVEPAARNTAASVLLSVKRISDLSEKGEKEIVFVSPSDQHIKDEKNFPSAVNTAKTFAEKGHIVILGTEPLMPRSDYGYIQKGERFKSAKEKIQAFQIKAFVEKPSEETARNFVKDKSFLWNTGMLFFSIEMILSEFQELAGDIYDSISRIDCCEPDKAAEIMSAMPAVSIDKAILEKTKKALVVPASFQMLDVGDWNLFYQMCPKDSDGNVIIGNVFATNVKKSLIISENNLTACCGMENAVIVNTDDVTFISGSESAGDVRSIVSQLNQKGLKEAVESTTSYRPWGQYTVLEEGVRYKIKKIAVNPGESLSLQKHQQRSEHWVVTRGIARVRIGEENVILKEGESTFVPVQSLHQLQNPGKNVLEIIEVQMGDYLGEDDIIRFEDKYGREKL